MVIIKFYHKFGIYQALLLAFIVTILSSCVVMETIVKKPKIKFESIRMIEAFSDRVTLVPKFKIINFNNVSTRINSINYQLTINDRSIYSSDKFYSRNKIASELDLLGHESLDVDFPATIATETIDFFVKPLQNNKKVNYSIVGDAKSDIFTVHFEHSGTIYLPEVELSDFKVNSARMTNLEMSLNLSMTNNNEFDLPVKNLLYTAKSGDTELFIKKIEDEYLGKKGTMHLNMPIRINLTNLITSNLELISHPDIHVEVEVIVDLGYMTLPFSIDKKINLQEHF